MSKTHYFYEFLEPISTDLAKLAQELEYSIFSNPRSMLTYARNYIEGVLQLISQAEDLRIETLVGLKGLLDMLHSKELLPVDILDALHFVRRKGNDAVHKQRPIRYSEALLSWEALYTISKWYVEVYGPVDLVVPNYVDPTTKNTGKFDGSEIEERLKTLEKLLREKLTEKTPSESGTDKIVDKLMTPNLHVLPDQPGFTTIRSITYKEEKLEIPYFLRDAFLLPQRFDKSELFLIRLGGEQEARLMSELPSDLNGLHLAVKRFNGTNDFELFQELKIYVEEEKKRQILKSERPGELFFFYHSDFIVVTEQLGQIPITIEEFIGFPNFIQQLNDQGYYRIGQLPKELVTLAKFKRVGKGIIGKFFKQLKEK